MPSKSKIKLILRLVILLEIIVLISTAMVISRDYQDSWVLEGLEIPFTLLMITNVLYFLVEDDIKWLILFATLIRFTIFVAPELKYGWYLGNAIDQHQQFRHARFVVDNGYVESGHLYSETPIMHIFFSTFSMVTNVSLLDSFKYLPLVTYSLYPIIIYSLMKKILPEHNNSSLIKWALLLISIPITPQASFTVTGTVFGSLLALLTLSELLKAAKTNNRKHLLLFLFFSVVLTYSHYISSTLLMIGILMVFMINKIFKIFKSNFISSKPIIFLISLNLLWIMNQIYKPAVYGEILERILGSYVLGLIGRQPTTWSPTGIRPRFFELNILNELRVLTVFYGGSLIVLFLAICGVLLAWKVGLLRKLKSEPLIFLSFYVVSLLAFFPIQFLSTVGKASLLQFHRIFRYTLAICPILVAFFIYYVNKRMRRAKYIIFTILLLTIALNTIETYGYRPLLPPSSSIAENLPSDEPINFLGWIGVNSVYQRSMIQHIEKYASKEIQIASDAVTRTQIIGLRDYEFSDNQLTNYYPLVKYLDEDIREQPYDIFLIHLPGKAGGLSEKAEIRTKELILETVQNSSVLYTNGESFILVYPGIEN